MEEIIEGCKEYLLALGGILLTQADFDAWLAKHHRWYLHMPTYLLYYQRHLYFVNTNWYNETKGTFEIVILNWKPKTHRTQGLYHYRDLGVIFWQEDPKGTRWTLVNFHSTNEN